MTSKKMTEFRIRHDRFLSVTIMAIIVFSFCRVEAAADEPVSLFLTWQQDPATTMTIDWHTIGEQQIPGLQYRRMGESRWNNASGTQHDFPYSQRIINRTELTGLEQDSKYEFRFGAGARVYTFRTMPAELTRPLRIAIGGDTMHHQDFFEMTNRQVLKYDPDFAVAGGDLAYADGLPPERQGLRGDPETMQRTDPRPGLEEGDNLWYHWFDAYMNTLITEEGRVIPMLVTIGNHEVSRGEAPYFFALFAMPGQPGYNVLDFGDYLSFILLDSGHVNPEDGEQKQWLEQVLAERQHVPHLFPKYHVPAYPSVRNFYDGRVEPVRNAWVSLFEQYNVRVAFENHDHAYKRTFPLRNGDIHSNGIVYIGDGSWGTVPRELGGIDGLVSYDALSGDNRSEAEEAYSRDYWYIARAKSEMHFILLTLDGPHRHMLMIDYQGNIIDELPAVSSVRN